MTTTPGTADTARTLTDQDRADYPFLIAYKTATGSPEHIVAQYVDIARRDGAPRTAACLVQFGGGLFSLASVRAYWRTMGEVSEQESRLIWDTMASLGLTEPECACAPRAETELDGVTVVGHTTGCDRQEPRTYVWLENGQLTAGKLSEYAAVWVYGRGYGDGPTLSAEIRTWDATYTVHIDESGSEECRNYRLTAGNEYTTVAVTVEDSAGDGPAH